MQIQDLILSAGSIAESVDQQGLELAGSGSISVLDKASGTLLIHRLAGRGRKIGAEAKPLILPGSDWTSILSVGEPGLLNLAVHFAVHETFQELGAVLLFHSPMATAWSQSGRDIPCLGNIHARSFHGVIPCSRPLTTDETSDEKIIWKSMGRSVVELLIHRGLTPQQMPGALIRSEGAVVWGMTAPECLERAMELETVARLAHATLTINPGAEQIPPAYLNYAQGS